MENLNPNSELALCIMMPIVVITFFIMIGGGFEKRPKKD
jgi:hypothetical protein